MAQVLKDEVRARILRAALEVFAAQGFIGATMATIAERGGLGTASLYRYYKSKDELFAAVVTPELAAEFESLLDRRVRALAQARRGDAEDELLRFWIAHRLEVVILLDRAQGTAYERYGQQFVDHLVQATLAQSAKKKPSPPARFVLERLFENTRVMLAAILARYDHERDVREAIAAFWSYQIPGLRGFAEHVSG